MYFYNFHTPSITPLVHERIFTPTRIQADDILAFASATTLAQLVFNTIVVSKIATNNSASATPDHSPSSSQPNTNAAVAEMGMAMT